MDNQISVALPGEHIGITTDTWTDHFWQAAKERRLTACQCGDCGHFRMPPTPFCPECQSQNVEWPTLSGSATVFSFAICNRSPFPDVEDFTYIPAVVDLDGAEGARLITNIVGVNPSAVKIGMKLMVDWHPIRDEWLLPIFRKA